MKKIEWDWWWCPKIKYCDACGIHDNFYGLVAYMRWEGIFMISWWWDAKGSRDITKLTNFERHDIELQIDKIALFLFLSTPHNFFVS